MSGVQPVVAQADPVVQAVEDQGSSFVPVAPLRVLDTRTGTGPVTTRTAIDLTGQVPASTTAVVFNLTGTEPSANTYVTASPTGYNVPEISNLNLTAGETRANLVTVALGPDRQVHLFNHTGSVHLVADLAGYYLPTEESRFTSTPPARVTDTRTGAAVGPGSTVEVDLSGQVPASARSVTFNLTATQSSTPTYVTAYPSGTARPTASNLNLRAGETNPNLVTVALGANRRVTLYNNAGSVHLIVDLAGFYATDRGDRFFPVFPTRTHDTRTAGGPLGAGQTREVNLATRIPPSAATAVVNLTGASPSANTFVTAYPSGTTRPLASNLNLTPQRDTANSAVVRLGADTRMTLYNNAGTTDLVVDLAGYFANAPYCVADCVHAWGGELNYGLTPGLRRWHTGITSVVAGLTTAYALRSDGTVWSWGDNQWGQLGAGGTGGSSTEPLRVAGLSGVTAIAAGTWAGYALKSDGTVWAWGWNDEAQLGDGTEVDSNVPVQVYGLTGVTAIAGTHQGAYALKSNGTVWAWGNNSSGGVSGGCPTDQFCPPDTPLQVAIPLPDNTRITAIAAGRSSTGYALRSDGTVWGWGRNVRGETGTGLTGDSVWPAQVVGLTDVVTIGGGSEVGYAVKSDGTVWAWGDDSWGTLGTGVPCTNNCWSGVPVQVSGLTDAVAVDGAVGTSVALRADGTVWTWGINTETGNLGNGTSGSCGSFPRPEGCMSRVPAQISLTGVSDIAAGALGFFAVRSGPPS